MLPVFTNSVEADGACECTPQVSDHYQKPKPCSIHLQDLRQPTNVWASLAPPVTDSRPLMWAALKKARHGVNKKLEEARQSGLIKSSLEARLTLHVLRSNPVGAALWQLDQIERERAQREGLLDYDLLAEFFVVSASRLVDAADPNVVGDPQSSKLANQHNWVRVVVERMPGSKCPRCWRWVVESNAEDGNSSSLLCSTCSRVLLSPQK